VPDFVDAAAQDRPRRRRDHAIASWPLQCSSANSLDRATIRSSNRSVGKAGFSMPALSRSPSMWILLLVPFIGLLWVPFYNFQDPALFGFPFFYWYQLAWVPISSLLIWLVYRRRTPDEAP
jgi:hypothetical protein